MRKSLPWQDPIYLAAAVPFALIALLASAYDGVSPYLIPVIVCIIQFIHPTRVGWILVTGCYGLVAGALGHALIQDLVSLVTRQRENILMSKGDWIFFAGLTATMTAFTWILFRRRRASHEV